MRQLKWNQGVEKQWVLVVGKTIIRDFCFSPKLAEEIAGRQIPELPKRNGKK